MVDAVRCAVEVQRGMAERNAATPPETRIEFRIGINLGDVIAEGEDIFGDGVNIAARLEALAEPGGVFVSTRSHDHVRDRLPFRLRGFGRAAGQEHRPASAGLPGPDTAAAKAIDAARPRRQLPLPDKPSIAVLPFANMSGDPEQEYFADGMVEEIITALSPHPLAVRDRPQFDASPTRAKRST